MKTKTKAGIGAMMIAAILLALAFRSANQCGISGTVTDKGNGDSIFAATVLLSQNGKQIQATTTDLDGKFCFLNVADGSYDVTVNAVGFETSIIKGVVVKDGKTTLADFKLSLSLKELNEVMVTMYRMPLIGESKSVGKGKSRGYYDMVPAPSAPSYDLEDEPRPKDKREKPKEEFNTEEYVRIVENEFLKPNDKPLSTFSIDVDVASYGILHKKIQNGQLPPKESVRIEELLNYFTYNYDDPKDDKPFSVTTEVGECPWNTKHSLLHVGIQGRRIEKKNLPPNNLVFLIDVSGSMQDADKLPLVKQSLHMLVNELGEKDKIAITVYAGSAGLVLPSTPCSNKEKIIAAIDGLEARGSTAGGAGINLAYKTAKENFLENGNNRVILCTDGDFNVGVSSDVELTSLIEKKREEGIFISVLGFGMGNYKDSKMEQLADKGNGNYAYIDNINEAKKNLVTQMGGTLLTIAKDVKLQVEFNPAKVKAYRLIGYENRALADKDFNDDKKDVGEIGAGISVTALYELITDENDADLKNIPKTDPLKYQSKGKETAKNSDEILTVKIRYKEPKESLSKLLEFPVKDAKLSLANTSDNFRFSASVASFGLLLRDSKFIGDFTFDKVKELAANAKGNDSEGYRFEFIRLVNDAKRLNK